MICGDEDDVRDRDGGRNRFLSLGASAERAGSSHQDSGAEYRVRRAQNVEDRYKEQASKRTADQIETIKTRNLRSLAREHN